MLSIQILYIPWFCLRITMIHYVKLKIVEKDCAKLEISIAAGIPKDTLINLKESAEFFELENGKLWVYTIESPTASFLGINIKDFDVLPVCI